MHGKLHHVFRGEHVLKFPLNILASPDSLRVRTRNRFIDSSGFLSAAFRTF